MTDNVQEPPAAAQQSPQQRPQIVALSVKQACEAIKKHCGTTLDIKVDIVKMRTGGKVAFSDKRGLLATGQLLLLGGLIQDDSGASFVEVRVVDIRVADGGEFN